MSAHSTPPSHLFFLTQPKGDGAILFSMRGTPRGPELSKIGTFGDRDEAGLLAATLNAAVLGGAGAVAKVHRRAASLPGPLSRAITDLTEEIKDARRDAPRARAASRAARAVAENMGQPNVAVFSLFRTTECGNCVACGCAVDEDCAKCLVCGPDGHGCVDCGSVGVTPRNAFVLHHVLKDLADRTYFTVRSTFWESSLPDSVETQTDWFLLHCARAYDDLATDLLSGEAPNPRCLAERVALGYALSHTGSSHNESVYTDETYLALPASRFDHDWEFLAEVEVGEAGKFLDSDVIEEDLWDEWFQPYPSVEPRDQDRGFRR